MTLFLPNSLRLYVSVCPMDDFGNRAHSLPIAAVWAHMYFFDQDEY